jgi:hypothetical protein
MKTEGAGIQKHESLPRTAAKIEEFRRSCCSAMRAPQDFPFPERFSAAEQRTRSRELFLAFCWLWSSLLSLCLFLALFLLSPTWAWAALSLLILGHIRCLSIVALFRF